MARSQPISATCWLEVGVRLEGVYHTGTPYRFTYAGGDPPDEGGVEDVCAVGLCIERMEPKLLADGKRVGVKHTTDLMEGVDARDPNVLRLLSNLTAVLGQDAVGALLEEIAE